MEIILPIYWNWNSPGSWTNIEWALGRAICEGFEDMIKLLVEYSTFEHQWGSISKPFLDEYMCLFAYRGNAEYYRANYAGGEYRADNRDMYHMCKSGRSLLACAIWGGNISMAIPMLNDRLIDVNAGSPGVSPIWDAVRTGSVEAVGFLFSSRLLKLRYGEGTALLALAKEKGNSELTELFQRAKLMNCKNLLFAEGIEDWTVQNSDYVRYG
tara:strand:+ start:328 stop:963 length:636 start_codon:yes stop_codon:yes gene_type:complete